jgi:hypothetical protein
MRQLHQDRPPRAEQDHILACDAPRNAIGTCVTVCIVVGRLCAIARAQRYGITVYKRSRSHVIFLEEMWNSYPGQVSQITAAWESAGADLVYSILLLPDEPHTPQAHACGAARPGGDQIDRGERNKPALVWR